MTSKLRSEVCGSSDPAVSREEALRLIQTSMSKRCTLIHGQLHRGNRHCAIGTLWQDYPDVVVPFGLVDEVAAINDSIPKATQKQRWTKVNEWLKFQLKWLFLEK